jgi:serine/threonine-protein kinase
MSEEQPVERRAKTLADAETLGLEGGASAPLPRTLGSQSILSLIQDVFGPAAQDVAVPAAPKPAPDAAASEGVPRKYQIAAEIGSGGMGVVLKAYDVDLHRWVAMKLLRTSEKRTPATVRRFIEEAQICAQLEHPNIPPVHEMGIEADGRVFFTMKMVKGRTLREIAHDLSLGRPDVRREFNPIRLAQILQQAALGVHYANVRGVIHRDLKPDNVMVGDYGEVLVLDWGLAKVRGELSDAGRFGEDPVVTERSRSGERTRHDVVQGTPAYMAPELARGEQHFVDARTDVFGLGAVLYECLCYRPPFTGERVQDVLLAARSGVIRLPSEVAPPLTQVPAELEAIAMKALAGRMEDRHADAREFQQDLQTFIEGSRDKERRRAQADVLVQEGRRHLAAYRSLSAEAECKRARAKEVAQKLAPSDPVETKRPLWNLEDEVDAIEREKANLVWSAMSAFSAAVEADSRCREAKSELADLYWQRFSDADARQDAQSAAVYRGLVEAHDDGRYLAKLKGDGSLVVQSEPAGADVALWRYERRDRLMVPVEHAMLGKTPIASVSLPLGSYLLVLRRPGFRDTRFPLYLPRPESCEVAVRLRTDIEIGGEFVYVPSSAFIFGGDAESYGGGEGSRPFVDDFFISRFPTTFAQYCEFLDAATLQGVDVGDLRPQQADESFVERGPDGRFRVRVDLLEGVARERHAPGTERECPVFGVSWHAASAYAEWRSERDGRRYTLPPEEAWEKAARGVDARRFPWGNDFDWTFAKGGLSRPEPAQPEPVGAFPADESPYGMRDAAGSIREWTLSYFDERAGLRVLRGGSWNLVVSRHFHCATRFGYRPEARTTTFGFRLYSVEPGR